jgi:hypothetical protein
VIADQKQLLKEHAARWARLGSELEAQRSRDLRKINAFEAIGQLSVAFDLAAKLPLRTSSGLVEQQALFQKIHHRK